MGRAQKKFSLHIYGLCQVADWFGQTTEREAFMRFWRRKCKIEEAGLYQDFL